MNKFENIRILPLLVFLLFAASSHANDLGSLEAINFKAFRDASVARECVNRGLLPEAANKNAYDRIYALDPKAALLLDSGYGVISIYLGDYLNEELHKNIVSLDVMSADIIKETCKFTNLRNMAGGTNPTITDSVNAHVANEIKNNNNTSQNIKYLISEVDRLDSACRGGSGDNPKTFEACDKRDDLYKIVEAAGWCYGENANYGYQKTWNPCLKKNRLTK